MHRIEDHHDLLRSAFTNREVLRVVVSSWLEWSGDTGARGVLRQFRAALLAGTALSLGIVTLGGQVHAVEECGPANQNTIACGEGLTQA